MHRRTTKPGLAQLAIVLIAVLGFVGSAAACSAPQQAAEPSADGDDTPIHVVIAIAEPEYKTETTLPAFAEKHWTKERGYRVTVITGDPEKHDLPGLAKALSGADVLVLSVRRQALPKAQLQAVRDYLGAGKPLLAIRTSSHAFALRKKDETEAAERDGRAVWPEFDADVLGGNYHGHYPSGEQSTVTAAKGAEDHAILKGITLPITSNAGVYKNKPLADSARPLLIAKPRDDKREPQPVAWTHRFGKAKVFYTSLGNTDDFKQPGFEKLLDQAMQWLCD